MTVSSPVGVGSRNSWESLPADGAAVGLGHQDGQAAPAVDVPVGPGHGLVAFIQAVVAGVEAVGVFHGEFTHPDEAGPGPGLVPELGLDLVEDDGEVPVALDVGLDDVGDDLLVGGGQHQRTAPPVFQREQVVAEGGAAAGLLPELGGLEGGHEDFLAARRVHLLTDDVLDLAQGAPGQGQVGVDPGGDLVNQAGAEHEAVAGRLGLGRVLPQGAGNQLGHSHGDGFLSGAEKVRAAFPPFP